MSSIDRGQNDYLFTPNERVRVGGTSECHVKTSTALRPLNKNILKRVGLEPTRFRTADALSTLTQLHNHSDTSPVEHTSTRPHLLYIS